MVLVSLPDTPPGETEEQVDIKNEMPVFFQKVFQPILPLIFTAVQEIQN
jgi:hypothetical protein